MSIIPDREPAIVGGLADEIPRAEEWAWDFEAREFKTRNGRMYKVYEDEAIKIWLWKLFLTERFDWMIHTERYGGEHSTLIGKGYTPSYINAVAEQMTREAIERNLPHYVTEIYPVQQDIPIVTFQNGILYITFYADTIYNKRGVEMSVILNPIV